MSKPSGPTKHKRAGGRATVVLGLDPGITATGWGVLQVQHGMFNGIATGVIRPKGAGLAEKLRMLFEESVAKIEAVHPDIIAIEKVFWNPKHPGALVLAQARGVLLLAASLGDCTIVELEPRVVKQTVAMFGGAHKQQIAKALLAVLQWQPKTLSPDAIDALAIALAAAVLSPSPRS